MEEIKRTFKEFKNHFENDYGLVLDYSIPAAAILTLAYTLKQIQKKGNNEND